MAKRYELSHRQWACLKDFLPGKAGDRGRTAVDNRRFVTGVRWVLRSGARWGDLPAGYGNWKSVHKRFTRWARAGVWEQVFAHLPVDRQNDYLLLDSTIVRTHQQAVPGKGGTCPRLWGVPEADCRQRFISPWMVRGDPYALLGLLDSATIVRKR